MDVVAKAHEFLWLDLETTGLDPAHGLVLEFAAVLCEDSRGDDFAVTAQYTGVIHHHADRIKCVRPDARVIQMHEDNGLWADVEDGGADRTEVDAFLAQLASSLSGGRKHWVRLAGSSVHFDLAWCRVHFPEFSEYLSHRVFDVTTLRAAVDAWSPTPVEWPVRNAHRACADVLASINEARVARHAMGWTP